MSFHRDAKHESWRLYVPLYTKKLIFRMKKSRRIYSGLKPGDFLFKNEG